MQKNTQKKYKLIKTGMFKEEICYILTIYLYGLNGMLGDCKLAGVIKAGMFFSGQQTLFLPI